MRKTEFGERLQTVMDELNLSQSDVARRVWGEMIDGGRPAARNRQQLGRYLSGEHEPRIETKRLIAEALRVPLARLDPTSDPASRLGSGVYVEEKDRLWARLVLDVTVPKALADKIVAMVSEFAK